ncbi:MAG TPA: 50S ribosomal protein L13 [candidate division Zixibacteria bacterium]|nr:50S ribosomal protein L13 [candidate division Zixibacteria bacterium]
MNTFMPKVDSNRRKWWLVDLDGAVMGRVATRVAMILRGKHTPLFTPHMDTGDHVVVVNAAKMRVTGANKPRQLSYYRYSGYPGGLRTTTYEELVKNKPDEAFRLSVRRMLPKNRLGRKMYKKLHVYAGAEHPHFAQKPEKLNV